MKNWKIWVGLAVTLAIASAGVYLAYRWWLAEPIPDPAQAQTAPVSRGSLVVTVKAVGAVTAPPEMTLNFGLGGRVAKLEVAEGDTVQAGDVLAQLDTTDSELQVAKAETALAVAQAQLARAGAGASEAEIASAQAGLSAAQAQYEQVQAGPLAADIAAAQAALKSAETSYEQLLAGPNKDEVAVVNANLEKAKIVRQRAQAEYDRFAWREGFEASPQAAALQQATIDYQQALASYNLAVAGPTDEQLDRTQAQIAQARAQLERLRAGGTSAELKGAAAQVARAQAELDRLLKGPTSEELAIAQAQVDQAQIALEQAARQIERATLVTPSSGTIVSVAANVGQSISAGTPVFTLVDLSNLQVKAAVNEMHIGLVQEGQKAFVRLEAFPDQVMEGRVSEIATLPTVVAGTANYPLTIELTSADVALRPGLAAQVEIITSEKTDALLVPKGALRLKEGKWTVSVLRQGQAIDTQVEIGGRQGRAVEVLDGLIEGEKVIMRTIPLGRTD